MKKYILIVGHEGTGSMLIGSLIAKNCNLEWDGAGIFDTDLIKFHHVSLPAGIPSQFENISDYIKEYEELGDLYIVITTRDITLSEHSRIKRFNKKEIQVREETRIATRILKSFFGKSNSFIFSYETFMIYENDYLLKLLDFIKIELKHLINEGDLVDANAKKILELQKMSKNQFSWFRKSK